MLVTFLVTVLVLRGSCEIPLSSIPKDDLVLCTMGILNKYFVETKELVYLDLDFEADILLRQIHALNIASVITKTSLTIVPDTPVLGITPYLAYMIVARNVEDFMYNIVYVNREANWNPYARFLVVIKNIKSIELKPVFDTLLTLHVNYVVVVNGSTTAELYTYNPFDNYACGKYYKDITEFGKCSSVTTDIYPAKVITGLRNCFFDVSVAHWPPYSIDPKKVEKGEITVGTEQYIFHLISEIEQFKYKFQFNYDPEKFSFINRNMSVSGPMTMLQNNLTDVMLGGLVLIPSRANLFFYIYGHLDQVDEIRIMVKKAWETPAWKDIYLEFSPIVWALLIFALLFYSILIVILLRKSDKGIVIMTLLDNLLSHGPSLNCRQTVKLIFIIWVWFAYLINSFYITSLMSLTMKPSLGFQISDEETIKAYRLTPCISDVMDKYRKTESTHGQILTDIDTDIKGCKKFLESIRSVGVSDRLFTIALYSIYLYHKQEFYNRYGRSPVYSFSKPYSKVIYAMYFYKGFPMYERLHSLAIRIRETGLSEKNLEDHFYRQKLKRRFHSKGYKSRFAMPWYVYIVGLFIASITFALEIASWYKNQNQNAPQ